MYFRPCAAQNTMLAIFDALSRSFLPAVSLYLAGFRCSVSEFGAMRLIISAALVGGHTRSRFSVMLSIIIGVNILNWYGAVIAQSGRQFYENVLYLSTVKFEKVGLIFRKTLLRFQSSACCTEISV